MDQSTICRKLKEYDAFLLYADSDLQFVLKLLEYMKKHGIKLCMIDDLLGGVPVVDAVIELITQSCQTVLIILSPDFFKSDMLNTFFCKFAQTDGIINNGRKIIPCVYKYWDGIPKELTCYHLLNYERCLLFKLNFWKILLENVQSCPEESFITSVKDDLLTTKIMLHEALNNHITTSLRDLPTNSNPKKYKSIVIDFFTRMAQNIRGISEDKDGTLRKHKVKFD